MPTVSDRVRSVVERLRLSQGEFADRVGLDKTKMSKSLAGVRRFSSLDLARIAEQGGVSVDWLLTGSESGLALAARVSTDSSTEQARAEAQRLAQARNNLDYLGYPQPWQPVLVPDRGGYEQTGYALAEAACQRLVSADVGPGHRELPDAVEQSFGADVTIMDLGSGCDGLSVITDQVKLILLGRSRVPWRQRFTLAHELGHLLAGDDQGLHLDVDIFDRQHSRLDSERQANAFATAFLMPKSVLRDAAGDRGFTAESFARLSSALRVSPSALAYRLQRLSLIDAFASNEFRGYSARRVAELAGTASDLATDIAGAQRDRPPGLLVGDAFAAYTAGATTVQPYALLLGVDPEQLRVSLEVADDEAADNEGGEAAGTDEQGGRS
jgi:Zn-dependent peptidase ImmA (M78 family)/transcriptional regulator with XRE-family HTH domain